MPYDEAVAARVREALSARRDVVEKKLMGGLCFMVNGAMCCSVSGKGGLLVRVEPDAQERILAEPHAAPMEMRGRTMRGFVRVSPEGYHTERGLKVWLQRGIDAIAALPEKKPSRRGKRKQ